MKTTSCLSLLLLVSFFVRGVAWADEPVPYKIGMVYSLSGPAEAWATYGRQAAEMAASEINAAGGVNGRQLKLIFEDSKTTAAGSVTAYKKLVNVDRVDALVGDVWDFVTNPMIPLARQDRKVLIAPTVVSSAIDNPGDYFFTMGAKLELTEQAIEKFFAIIPEVKSTAIVCWDDHWGRAYLKVWKSVIQKRGIDILEEPCVYGFDYDYRSDMTRIARKKPAAVIMGYQEDRIIKRMREQGLNSKVLTTSNVVDVLHQQRLPAADLEGVYFTDWDPAAEFQTSFLKAWNRAPLFEAHSHYEVIRSIAKGFEQNPGDLLAGLKTLRYEGVAGVVDFTRGFDVNQSVAVLKVIRGGKIELAR